MKKQPLPLGYQYAQLKLVWVANQDIVSQARAKVDLLESKVAFHVMCPDSAVNQGFGSAAAAIKNADENTKALLLARAWLRTVEKKIGGEFDKAWVDAGHALPPVKVSRAPRP